MKRIILRIGWSLVFCAAWAQNVSDHFYAVILSGGRTRLMNHERYWNDCAFLYQTLRQTFHIPQRNVTLLMADGDNPERDMLRTNATGFASSPTDLDGDGQADLHLAATRQNLRMTMEQLAQQLTSDDHLLLYIVDHGELTADGDAYFWLWNEEQLRPGELATLLAPLSCGTMTIVLGHCHAGAFVGPLVGDGRIVLAACGAGELSWSCADRPYDEFVYHWTCALAQHDEHLNSVAADLDGDGRITMTEAFAYARSHDRRQETPTMHAQPEALADRWSLSGVTTDGMSGVRTAVVPSVACDLLGRRMAQNRRGNGVSVERGRKKLKKR